MTVVAVAVAAITGAVLYGPIGGAGGAVLGALVPFALLSRATAKRLSAFQSQLADILMIVASSLRAGHSFQQALDSASQEIGEPGAAEFGLVMSEVRLGRDVDDALDALVKRTGSKDLEWAVAAIQIQRKVGGNLAEVLETVARTIRERETLRRQVRVMSAEGRISVLVLTVLPIAVAVYLMTINPDYLRTLTATTTGIIMLIAAGVLMVVGYIWMQKIVRLDDV
jgi:tight adherence protein B